LFPFVFGRLELRVSPIVRFYTGGGGGFSLCIKHTEKFPSITRGNLMSMIISLLEKRSDLTSCP